MYTIYLTPIEERVGKHVGITRNLDSLKKNSKPGYGFHGTPEEMEEIHIIGAQGECATAKSLQIYWPMTIGNYSGPDLGEDIQVRTRTRENARLYIRPKTATEKGDNLQHRYILALRLEDKEKKTLIFKIMGWIHGHEANKSEWWTETTDRPPCWFIPTDKLHDMNTFVVK